MAIALESLTRLLVMVALSPVGEALAFDAEHLKQLLSSRSCVACDLSRARLEGQDLTGADLRGANLASATLDTANLDRANLRGADLSNATGSFLSLEDADLSGATLRGFDACYDQNFRGAILRGADLSGAQLCATAWHRADLAGADFSGADLTHAMDLDQKQLDRACGNAMTKLPSDKMTIPRCASD